MVEDWFDSYDDLTLWLARSYIPDFNR
jgi:hypothetical protein